MQWGSASDLKRLRLLGEQLTDAKKARSATVNRVERGGGAEWDVGTILIADAWEKEVVAGKMLTEHYKQVAPGEVRAWAAEIPGLGTGELFPRMIAIIGNPLRAIPHHWATNDELVFEDGRWQQGAKAKEPIEDEPYDRGVRQLWSWAGCGDPDRNPKYMTKPTREELMAAGMRTTLRPLLYTFSSYLLRAHTRSDAVAASQYWKIFTTAKDAGLRKTHTRQCQNKKRPPLTSNGCGTVQHPEWGAPGSPWRPGHAQAHAHRIVHKELLHDLWHAAGGPPCDRN